jgi:hypothetical protein
VVGGEGYVDVFAQRDADHYERIARVKVPVGARTGLFVPERNELFVAISQSARQSPEMLVFAVE